ncbi:S-methyl-5'-thioinosine phosphorylase [Sinomonas sp. ASV322]|uniref:S-methyl-5'-thioinosine phosphorylase n=1 Tax=Sinomonas sp. ASV322 TaxID=3041920 RepID=UPI0027DBC287|nr:S-methyl-5'-thioinosine phosphorylase [Sinomonas sp. ASV322]MDQ4503522.1 S-methyl-5'-thioinosine phosphorylase [Sinomonas sp. ASV322]
MNEAARVAIIGGSGLYKLEGRAEELEIPTPYGPTSGAISLVDAGGATIAFLARHGRGHTVAPQAVNYRANLWALTRLGVSAVFASAACGGLVPELAPGTFVIPDQFIDRTWGRRDTYFDGEGPGAAAGVQHLPASDPYCPDLRRVLAAAMDRAQLPYRPTATMAVINGPRFSTRAESRWLAQAGAHVVGMTQYPEAVLAAELGMGYATLAFVTDSDAGEHADEAVTADAVWARLTEASKVFERVLTEAARRVPADYEPRRLLPESAVRSVMTATPATPRGAQR